MTLRSNSFNMADLRIIMDKRISMIITRTDAQMSLFASLELDVLIVSLVSLTSLVSLVPGNYLTN